MLLRSAIFAFWWKFLAADISLCSAEDGPSFHLFNSSSTFHLSHGGLHRVRVLAVGGGGAGCNGVNFAKARASIPAVDVFHVSSPTDINVTVGRGGTETGAGMMSSFGSFVRAAGGAGCEIDFKASHWKGIRGIHRFRLNTVTKGADGPDGTTAMYAAGGEGGVLIDGEGPTASQGSQSTSGLGGKGFGAGGGSGGQAFGKPLYLGGNGAPGVVYIEVTRAGCQEEGSVIFAVEGMNFKERYQEQLRFVRFLISILPQTSDNSMRTQVGLILYRDKARLVFQPSQHRDVKILKKNTLAAINPFNDSSEVNFSVVLERAYFAFAESGDETQPRSLVIFTFSSNVKVSNKLLEYKKRLENLNVVITVVGLAENLTRDDLVALTTDVSQVLLRKITLTPLAPWIIDSICQVRSPDAPVVRSSSVPLGTVVPTFHSSRASPTPSVMSSTIAHDLRSSAPSLSTVTKHDLPKTPSALFSTNSPRNTPIHNGPNLISAMTSFISVLAVTPTPVTSTLRSTTVAPLLTTMKPSDKQSTKQKFAEALRSFLSFNVSAIDINDKAALKEFIGLVGNLLSHRLEVGNTTKELPAFQVINVVEQVAMKLASQLSPHRSDRGIARLELKSKETVLSILALNVTRLDRLPLRDSGRGSEANGSEDIILPASAFSNFNNGIGRAMALTYTAIDQMSVSDETEVSSKVVKVLAKPMASPPFKTPVEMTFPVRELLDKDLESKCMFWNPNERTVERPYGWWDDQGCERVHSNRTHVTCQCYHLTNFAVITRVKDYQRTEEVERSLDIISYAGISLSLFGCVLTILTHAFLPSLWSDRTTIHVNLVVAILLSQTLFLSASYTREPKALCLSTAIVAYYFYMCVFTWMLVEGVHIYVKVVRVFQESHSRKKIYFLVGWGAPVIATIVSAGAFRKNFVSNKFCWLSVESGAIWTFIGPVLFVILVNTIILCMVMRITAKMFKDDVNASARALVKGFVALLPILGLAWLFGILAINSATIVFEYLFAIFNSLQGFLIFLFCCVTNTEVRREFKRKVRNLRASRNPRSSYSLSHSGRGHQDSHRQGKGSEMKHLTRDTVEQNAIWTEKETKRRDNQHKSSDLIN